VKLKAEWKIAVAKATSKPAMLSFALRMPSGSRAASFQQTPLKGTNTTSIQATPITLKQKCARAARLAWTFAPKAASQAVTVVPMFSPSTMAAELRNTPTGSVSTLPSQPLSAQVMVMAMAAEEDWTISVRRMPPTR
jgi:hypothetical protein